MRRQWVFHTAALAIAVCVSAPCGAQRTGSHSADASLPAQQAADEFKRAIRELYDVKEKAWARGDAETIVTRFYSEDALSAGEGDPQTLVGRAAFRRAYQQYVKDVPTIRIESVSSYVRGDAGWDWANFYSEPKPDKKSLYPPSPIRIVFLWAREHGHWICKGDIFVNGKLPPVP